MGNIIQISGANYVNNLDSDVSYDFNIRSATVTGLSFDGLVLKFSRTGLAANYSTVANSALNSANITMPVGHLVGTNAVVLGVLADGNYAVLYLGGTGVVAKFWQDEHVNPTTIYTMPAPRPVVPKGSAYTIEKKSDRFTISYVGYSQDILFTAITGLVLPAIGVLGTGSALIEYGFIALT